MATGRDKVRESVAGVTPVPNWMEDELFPLLTGDEIKVLNYILRRTWGIGRRRTRIAISHICNGVVWEGEYVDRGTGLPKRRVQPALRELYKYGAVVKTAKESRKYELPAEMKPGWRNVVDIRGLKARYLETIKTNWRQAGNWGVEATEEARLPERISSIPDVSDKYSYEMFVRSFIDDGYEAEVEIDFTIEDSGSDVAEDGMGQTTMKQYIKDRVDKFLVPEAVKAAGIELSEWVEMKNVLLDITNLRATADSGLVPNADQALAGASDTAALAVVNHITSAKDLAGLADYWKSDWRCQTAARNGQSTTPTFKQLASIIPGYAAKLKAPPPASLHVYRGPRPDEDDFVPSELDRRKASTRSD